jgi:hypothetical protein
MISEAEAAAGAASPVVPGGFRTPVRGATTSIEPAEDSAGFVTPVKWAPLAVERIISLDTGRRFFNDWFEDQSLPGDIGELPEWSRVEALPKVVTTGQGLLDEIIAHSPAASVLFSDEDSDLSDCSHRLRSPLTARTKKKVINRKPVKRPRDNRLAIPAMAVAVEILTEGISGRHKGKTVDPSERGPEFEALRNLSTGQRPSRKQGVGSLEDRKQQARATSVNWKGPSVRERWSSELPAGGYFSSTTNLRGSNDGEPDSTPSSPPSSSSGHDSTSETESSDGYDGHRRKKRERKDRRERRKVKKAMSGVKIKTPFVWNGRADLDLFDQWCYEVDTWFILSSLEERYVIRMLVQFLSHLPSRFFMKYIAQAPETWTLKNVYRSLFDYCFPSDFKLQLRAKLTKAQQGRDTKVRDFVRDLETLAIRFPDINAGQVKDIFWRGLHQYLRLYLIEQGMNPERNDLPELVEMACRKEDAVETRKREAVEARGYEGSKETGQHSRFQSRGTGPQPYQPRDFEPRPSGGGRPLTKESRTNKHEGRKTDRDRGQPVDKRPRRVELTKTERDELRAAGKCFNCKEAGHESRNCPKRRLAPAPKIHTSAARIANIELLAKASREAHLELNAARDLDAERRMLQREGVLRSFNEYGRRTGWCDPEADDALHIIDHRAGV